MRTNALGQPIGEPVVNWRPPKAPPKADMLGRYCRLSPLDPHRDTQPLWDAYATETEPRNWTYLYHGPYDSFDEFAAWVASAAGTNDPTCASTTSRPTSRR